MNRTDRRSFLRKTAMVGVAALAASPAMGHLDRALADELPPDPPPPPPAPRPNVLLIVTDDQRADELGVMPRVLADIAALGTNFGAAILNRPYCGPSRATILSGQTVGHHQVSGNSNSLQRKWDATRCLPVDLQAAGYRTCHVGKYINFQQGSDPVPPGWDDWHGISSGFSTNSVAYTRLVYNDNGTFVSESGNYSTYADRVRAETFLDAQDGTVPWFLHLCPVTPHNGTNMVAPEYATAPATFEHRPNFDEADVSDKPVAVQRLRRLTDLDVKNVGVSELRRLRALMACDDLVGAVLDRIATLGQLDNTVVIFTSDNGFMRGEHRIRSGKMVAYEEAVAVPFMMRGPGIPAQVRSDVLVSNVDIAPTICALAGATPSRVPDGRDVLGMLDAPDLDRIVQIDGGAYNAIRSLNWKFIQQQRTLETELYDLVADPYEMTNLAAVTDLTPYNAALAAAMT